MSLSTGLLNTTPTFPGSAQVHSSESHQELLLVTGDSKVGGRAGVTQATCVPFALALLSWDFPARTVGKNPPANAGDMGSVPDPGRCHMPWSN